VCARPRWSAYTCARTPARRPATLSITCHSRASAGAADLRRAGCPRARLEVCERAQVSCTIIDPLLGRPAAVFRYGRAPPGRDRSGRARRPGAPALLRPAPRPDSWSELDARPSLERRKRALIQTCLRLNVGGRRWFMPRPQQRWPPAAVSTHRCPTSPVVRSPLALIPPRCRTSRRWQRVTRDSLILAYLRTPATTSFAPRVDRPRSGKNRSGSTPHAFCLCLPPPFFVTIQLQQTLSSAHLPSSQVATGCNYLRVIILRRGAPVQGGSGWLRREMAILWLQAVRPCGLGSSATSAELLSLVPSSTRPSAPARFCS